PSRIRSDRVCQRDGPDRRLPRMQGCDRTRPGAAAPGTPGEATRPNRIVIRSVDRVRAVLYPDQEGPGQATASYGTDGSGITSRAAILTSTSTTMSAAAPQRKTVRKAPISSAGGRTCAVTSASFGPSAAVAISMVSETPSVDPRLAI